MVRSMQKSAVQALILLGLGLTLASEPGFAQVSPVEILNPRLKALEKAHLSELTAMNREIASLRFPYKLVLSRYVGLDPKDQIGADARGLEFVVFHGRIVLKISGNYNAAYNASVLSQNQCANDVLDNVVVPILRLVPKYFPSNPEFDGFGFEISYHVRTHDKQFGYEGKENLTIVFDNNDVPPYLAAQRESEKQEILNRAEVYVDGKEFGLALGDRDPFDVEGLEKPDRSQPAHKIESASSSPPVASKSQAAAVESALRQAGLYRGPEAALLRSQPAAPATSVLSAATPAPSAADLESLQKKYQAQLDALNQEGLAHYRFVDYAPPSLVLFHDQVYIQVTLRNPAPFDKNATSIYKRAAQSFDLFLAPQLKGLLSKIPPAAEITGLDITVLDNLSGTASVSSEALEIICPLSPLRQFADAEITNQDLINQSIVLVNGVRIALNLQQVE